MEDYRTMMLKPPSKLKMVECRALLGCNETEWIEIGSVLLEITKEFELSSISWSDQRYEEAAAAALQRQPILKSYLSRLDKDEKYRYELVKRMITVKAKKQTELEMKRRHKSGAPIPHKKPTHGHPAPVSMDSRSQSPEDPVPLSPKSSPIPAYSYDYQTQDQMLPKPFQHGRVPPVLSPQSVQSNPTEISDIFLGQAHQYVSAFRNMQERLRQRDGEIYALQSRVIELERQLDAYRRVDVQNNGVDLQRRPYRR